jgi:hypothetical protein
VVGRPARRRRLPAGHGDPGNNIVEPPELCDGTDLDGETCTSLGQGDGTLLCHSSCMSFRTHLCGDPY